MRPIFGGRDRKLVAPVTLLVTSVNVGPRVSTSDHKRQPTDHRCPPRTTSASRSTTSVSASDDERRSWHHERQLTDHKNHPCSFSSQRGERIGSRGAARGREDRTQANDQQEACGRTAGNRAERLGRRGECGQQLAGPYGQK